MKYFQQLSDSIELIHNHLRSRAINAVNQALTIRNWLIGYYVVEFEQNGEDRAKYGSNLLGELSQKIKIKDLTAPELSRWRQFYNIYPQILGAVPQVFENLLLNPILGSLTQRFDNYLTAERNTLEVPPGKLLTRLFFTYFTQLIKLDDPLKRTFYEIECIKRTWSIRELKRQIAKLCYERSGLSAKLEKLEEIVDQKTTRKLYQSKTYKALII